MLPKHIALHDQHVALGAKMIPFAGFEMPIQYSGIIDEHLCVRNAVGVFDVSHMGEFEVRGDDAETWLNRITTNNVAKLEVGQVQYSAMLYDEGGVVDDLLVYRFADRFMLVVNAANIAKDFTWLHGRLEPGIELTDISDRITLLAIQGPRSAALVSQITDQPVNDIVYYHHRDGFAAGVPVVISRTGYTGEDGFEIYVARDASESLWDAVLAAGEPLGLKPVGLGARDSLRLEACFRLYGNDMDAGTNPIEAGLGWIVKSKKPGGFIGLDAVLRARENSTRSLVGFALLAKGIARQHSAVMIDGRKVGEVTSGGYSRMIDRAIGLAYIDKPYDEIGTCIEIDVRGRIIPAEVVPTPFYKRID